MKTLRVSSLCPAILFASGLVFAGVANGALVAPVETTLVTYSMAVGNEFAPTSVGDGLGASALGVGASSAELQAGSSLPGSVFLNPTIDSPTIAASRANGQYFEFTVSSAFGDLFAPDGISFSVGNGGVSTPRGWAIFSSVDGFTNALASASVSSIQPTMDLVSAPLTGFDLSAEPVTFRIYEYAPAAEQGMFFDDISVTGQVVAVPETSSFVLVAIATTAGFLRRRRH